VVPANLDYSRPNFYTQKFRGAGTTRASRPLI
jgi:hypothetical protein